MAIGRSDGVVARMEDGFQLSGRKVLVTGADGFIGSHLAEALARAGATVTALSLYNSFGGNGWLDELAEDCRDAVAIVRGDIRDPQFVLRAAEGADIVFHLAALIAIPYSYQAVQSYIDTNVTGTVNVLEAARHHGVGRVVHTSTSEVYGTARFTPITESHPMQGQSPYSASKIGADHMVEAYARSFDLPAVILRPFNTYGPRQSERAVIPTIIRQILDPDCPEIRLGDLTPVRDFNYVADTCDAFVRIGGAEGIEFGRAYNAGAGVAVSIGETLETLLAISGCNKPVVQEEARLRPAASEVRELLAGAELLRTATGWAPHTPLREGLETTFAWWQARVRAGKLRAGRGYAV